MLKCIGDKRRLEILRCLATKPSYGLELGKNEVTQNLEYVYVAEQDGTLYFTVVEMLYNGNPVTESVLGSSVQMTINGSSVSVFNKSYEVQTGDELALIVKDYSWDGSGVVSANINLSFEGYFEHALGSLGNPVELMFADSPTESIEIPEAHVDNPQDLIEGDNTVTLEMTAGRQNSLPEMPQ